MKHQQGQRTIKDKVSFSGIGVHLGCKSTIELLPAPANHGITIAHITNPQHIVQVGKIIPEQAMHATVLRQGKLVFSTIEHVMAALHALGIDNIAIVVDAYEFPILDGSALPFIQGLLEVGIVGCSEQKKFITPKKSVSFEDKEGRRLVITPAQVNDFRLFISYEAEFAHQLIAQQRIEGFLELAFFMAEVAPARTFGFLDQLPFLRSHGLAQGSSLGNTVVIGPEGYMNELRFVDEFVRHKYLDLIGDLFLTGYQLIGRVQAYKTGHSFNRLVVKHILDNPEEWIIL